MKVEFGIVDKMVSFTITYRDGCREDYCTDSHGEGLWRRLPAKEEWKQVEGTCQFRLHQQTRSGKARAIKAYFKDIEEYQH